jgi:hypothetical protein
MVKCVLMVGICLKSLHVQLNADVVRLWRRTYQNMAATTGSVSLDPCGWSGSEGQACALVLLYVLQSLCWP